MSCAQQLFSLVIAFETAPVISGASTTFSADLNTPPNWDGTIDLSISVTFNQTGDSDV